MDPIDPTINIRYERAGQCFWHVGCKTQHHSPPMKSERDDEANRRTLIRCMACSEAGWFPFGAVGELACEREPSSDEMLLKAAAKAAGLVLTPYTWDKNAPWGEHHGFTVEGDGPDEWNPLENYGQALQLAASLDLQITPYPVYATPKHAVVVGLRAWDSDAQRSISAADVVEQYGDNGREAAWCRAIVRAAASSQPHRSSA